MIFEPVQYLKWVSQNIYPSLTYLWAMGFGLVFQFTFSGYVMKKTDTTAFDSIIFYLKKRIIVLYVMMTLLFLGFTYIIGWMTIDKKFAGEFISLIFTGLAENLSSVGSILAVLTSFVMFPIFTFIYRRTISPYMSSFLRRYRVNQTSDSLSDIRIEHQKNQSKIFDNRKYYKDGFIFMGLKENDEPIYITDEEFKSKNLKIIGATQTGKGVIQQVLIDQSIMKGWGVWFLDQKPDDFIYSVMEKSCHDFGREKPIILDLTGYSYSNYNPFVSGTVRERLDRFFKCFELSTKGTDADYYKNLSRTLMIKIAEYWDGTLKHLEQILNGKDDRIPKNLKSEIIESGDNIRTKLAEWKLCPNLFCGIDEGFNTLKAIDNGSVVYIKSRADDEILRSVANSLLIEWKNYIIESKPKIHNYLVLDEAKHVISENIASALATVLAKNANMSLAYQERDDLENLPDRTINGKMIKNQIETNTLITLMYACSSETAKWGADESGTIRKSVTKMEQLETDSAGSEKWTGNRSVGSEEENLITSNVIMSLKPRIGILYLNNDLAQKIYTCFIKLENNEIKEIPQIDDISIEENVNKNEIKKETEHHTEKPNIDNIENKKSENFEDIEFDIDSLIQKVDSESYKKENNKNSKETNKENIIKELNKEESESQVRKVSDTKTNTSFSIEDI